MKHKPTATTLIFLARTIGIHLIAHTFSLINYHLSNNLQRVIAHHLGYLLGFLLHKRLNQTSFLELIHQWSCQDLNIWMRLSGRSL